MFVTQFKIVSNQGECLKKHENKWEQLAINQIKNGKM